ncbi:hypothetical protein PybrP1_008569, partial [[Pythium] brassicae (nom. inval.)]
ARPRQPLHRERLFATTVSTPDSRKVPPEWNAQFTSEVNKAEVFRAIRALARHKAPGLDQISNDVFIECGDILAPYLVPQFNEIIAGADMPESFAKGLIIPLRKNGDSNNALDYRPSRCSSRSTRYSRRSSQIACNQGFKPSPARRSKALSEPGNSNEWWLESCSNPIESADDAPAIVLLDFMKAYDMLNHDFLLLTLQRFRVPNEVRASDRADAARDDGALHNQPGPVTRGTSTIGHPTEVPSRTAAFIIVAEVLALMIQADGELPGLGMPGGRGETVNFAAFVDDIAPPATTRSIRGAVRAMGSTQNECHHPAELGRGATRVRRIPVLQPRAATKYTGIQVRYGETVEVNRDKRIAGIKVQLVKAALISTSVVERVVILNAIVLPVILFTAQFSKVTDQTLQRLKNIQKKLLWDRELTTEGRRHTINP